MSPAISQSVLAAAASPAGVLSAPLTLWQVLSILLTVGGLGLIAITVLLRRKPKASADELALSAQLQSQRAELERLMDDARELTHLLGSRLDQQADRAEATMERLKAMLASIEAAEASVPPPAPPEPVREEQPESEIDALAARVYELADQGVVASEIARRLGQHTGKVELLLALRAGLERG